MPAPSNVGSSPNLANSGAASGAGSTNGLLVCNEACGIRDVWASNLEEEFHSIIRVVQKYNYVAMVSYLPHALPLRWQGPSGKFSCGAIGLPFLHVHT